MSWAIVLTADELKPLLLANVAWHLSQGASCIYVYLDNPSDPVAADLRQLDRVDVTLCDKAHWAKLNNQKGRPVLQMTRQSLNANHALKRAKADWLVHLDADEFLQPTGNLELEFKALAELDVELHFPVWERAYLQDQPILGLFDGVMRGTSKGRHRYDPQIFQNDTACHRMGVMAHAAGKCAVPTGKDFVLGVHWSFRGKRGRDNRSQRYTSTAARLLHFDGMTPMHWILKLIRYAAHDPKDLDRLVPDNRMAQIQALLEEGTDLESAQKLHDHLRVLPQDYADRLQGFGLLDPNGFDPLPQIRSVLPDFELPELSRFDQHLLNRYPDVRDVLFPK